MISLDDLIRDGFKPLSLNRNPAKPRLKSVGSLLTTRKDKLFISPVYMKNNLQFYGEPIELQGFSVVTRKGLRELINNATGEAVQVKPDMAGK